jgi:hypothetical protein
MKFAIAALVAASVSAAEWDGGFDGHGHGGYRFGSSLGDIEDIQRGYNSHGQRAHKGRDFTGIGHGARIGKGSGTGYAQGFIGFDG